MTKYLKIVVSGPYVNTDQTSYVELSDKDDLNDEGDIHEYLREELVVDAINEYVEAYGEVVDKEDIPEGEL